MRIFQSTQLSASRRPELQSLERILVHQDNVGLYEGKEKMPNQQQGVGYLTTHRFIYVDAKDPVRHSAELPLQWITHIENYNGFLRSSAKAILTIDKPIPSTIPSTQAMTMNPSSGIWICKTCSFSNHDTRTQCQLCGLDRPSLSTADHATVQDTSVASNVCRVCTFENHPDMLQCEMCLASLTSTPPPLPQKQHVVVTPSISPSSSPLEDERQVRISFRSGGLVHFVDCIRIALADKAWEKQPPEPPKADLDTPLDASVRHVGISAIQSRIKASTQKADDTLSDAFQDLDCLVTKATEMVKLAEAISRKMSKDPSRSDRDMSELHDQLVHLGIESPVTRDSAGSIYHQELARELADFLTKMLDRDSVKPLTDIYCLLNRARGVALISPDDLYRASLLFEKLHLPFRLRRFEGGLLAIQSTSIDDDRIAQHILELIRAHGGTLTAIRLAEMDSLAPVIATEQLIVTEKTGLICRDQGPVGMIFYENLFNTL